MKQCQNCGSLCTSAALLWPPVVDEVCALTVPPGTVSYNQSGGQRGYIDTAELRECILK